MSRLYFYLWIAIFFVASSASAYPFAFSKYSPDRIELIMKIQDKIDETSNSILHETNIDKLDLIYLQGKFDAYHECLLILENHTDSFSR